MLGTLDLSLTPTLPSGAAYCPMPLFHSLCVLGKKHRSLTTSTPSYIEVLMLGWGSRSLSRVQEGFLEEGAI